MNTHKSKTPSWWNDQHSSAWDRSKDAMKRDWEQTKHDFSKKSGAELKQNASDTVKQAAGSQLIPPGKMPNQKGEQRSEEYGKDFSEVESAYRYGVGASQQFANQRDWNADLEAKLEGEWFDEGHPWAEAKPYVRRGFEKSRHQQ